MKTNYLLAFLFTLSMFVFQSCDKCKDVDCEYGYCEDGDCECYDGYYGNRCQYKSGGGSTGGNCIYNQWTGSLNCSDPGYNPVSSTKCCPSSTPFHCSVTSSCYASCEAAESACGSTTVNRANVSGGGGGTSGYICSGGSCSSVSSGATYSTLSSCQSNCGSSSKKVTFWSDFQGSPISVYVNGSYSGQISSIYNSSPGCSASGCVTKTLTSSTTISYTANDGTNNWSGSKTLNNSCTTINLTR